MSNVGSGLKLFRLELIEALITQGHQVYVSFSKDGYQTSLEQLGCVYIETPMDRRGTNPLKDIKLFFQYLSILGKEKPDIVLTYTIKPNVYGGLASRLKKISCLSTVTGLGTSVENPGVLQAVALLLYRVGLKKANCIFFQNIRNQLFMEQHRIGGRAARFIPGSGVNLLAHPYCAYPPEHEIIRFLFVGRVMRDKGIGELLSCARAIHQRYPNTVFSVAGGYDEPEYEAQIKAMEKDHIIHYLGWQNDMQGIMAGHHCIIHPSYHEGLSNVLLEAAACGRPVIASNVPGCEETFEDGVTGLGVPARNADALTAAVERFICLPYAEKKKMGRLGREKVEREFDRTVVVDAYLKEIQRLGQRLPRTEGALRK